MGFLKKLNKTLNQLSGFDYSRFDGSPVVVVTLLTGNSLPAADRAAADLGYFHQNVTDLPGGFIQVTYRKG